MPTLSNKEIKIYYLINELNNGGAERALTRLICTLPENFTIRIGLVSGQESGLTTKIQKRVTEIDYFNHSSINFFSTKKKLMAAFHSFNPNITHSWLFQANLLSRFFRHPNSKIINSFRVKEPRIPVKLLNRMTKNKVHHFTSVSPEVTNYLDNMGFPLNQITTIENGVDDLYSSEHNKKHDDKICGITVARIVPQKGIDVLLKSLANVEDKNWTWKIIGDSPDKTYLKKMIALSTALGLSSKISWIGNISNQDVIDHYHKSDIFVLPSRWEGQSNAILEAISAGIETIASSHSGIGTNAPFTVVSNLAPKTWSKQIEVSFEKLRKNNMAKINHFEWKRKHSWKKFTDKHIDLYARLLNENQ